MVAHQQNHEQSLDRCSISCLGSETPFLLKETTNTNLLYIWDQNSFQQLVGNFNLLYSSSYKSFYPLSILTTKCILETVLPSCDTATKSQQACKMQTAGESTLLNFLGRDIVKNAINAGQETSLETCFCFLVPISETHYNNEQYQG